MRVRTTSGCIRSRWRYPVGASSYIGTTRAPSRPFSPCYYNFLWLLLCSMHQCWTDWVAQTRRRTHFHLLEQIIPFFIFLLLPSLPFCTHLLLLLYSEVMKNVQSECVCVCSVHAVQNIPRKNNSKRRRTKEIEIQNFVCCADVRWLLLKTYNFNFHYIWNL